MIIPCLKLVDVHWTRSVNSCTHMCSHKTTLCSGINSPHCTSLTLANITKGSVVEVPLTSQDLPEEMSGSCNDVFDNMLTLFRNTNSCKQNLHFFPKYKLTPETNKPPSFSPPKPTPLQRYPDGHHFCPGLCVQCFKSEWLSFMLGQY